jgi:putative adenylate-forming enzyme
MWQQLGILYHQVKGRYQGINQTVDILKAYQSSKLAKVLNQTSTDIPYYQTYKQATLHEYPIIDKTFVQDHFALLNRAKLTREEALNDRKKPLIEIHQSLGTAGLPGIYLYSAREKVASLGNLLGKMLPHFWQSKRIAVFHLAATPYFSERFSAWKMHWLCLNLNEDFTSLVQKLKNFDPEVILGSVQTLCALAKLQHQGELSLRCHKIIATSEVLTPLARKWITNAFGLRIDEIYQCAEGSLGMTCEHGTMHLNEAEYFIEKEWIDPKKRRFIPVVTTLKRRLQPLIRYRMEDILVLKNGPCPCGDPNEAIESIIGRCEDVLYFKERTYAGLKPIYADTLAELFSTIDISMSQYQVIQYSMRHIVVKLLVEDFMRAQRLLSEKLADLWQRKGIAPPLLEFDILEAQNLNQMFRTTKRLAKSTVTLLT